MADQQLAPAEIIGTVTANALADGLKPPFVICFINPDGAVLAVRTHPDRPVELLVNNGVDHCAGVQGVGVLLDKSGEKHTWTMRETKTEMTG